MMREMAERVVALSDRINCLDNLSSAIKGYNVVKFELNSTSILLQGLGFDLNGKLSRMASETNVKVQTLLKEELELVKQELASL